MDVVLKPHESNRFVCVVCVSGTGRAAAHRRPAQLLLQRAPLHRESGHTGPD